MTAPTAAHSPNTAGREVRRLRLVPRARSLGRLWPLLLPAVLLLPGAGGFPYPSAEASFSDLTISHYPNAVFLREELLSGAGLPLWSPLILSGAPFAADPLSGLWYPPGWLALLLPLPLGFNLLVLLHLLLGGLALYALLRREGLGHPAALLGGMAFAALPKLFAHYGAGHLTLLYAVPWTPVLLLAARGEPHHPSKVMRQPGLVLALIFLADPRWAVYAGLLWVAYAWRGRRGLGPAAWALRQAPQLALAFLLSAPLSLPLLEFTRLSTRGEMGIADLTRYSLEPAGLLGLLFPALGGFHERQLYPGAAIALLVMICALLPTSRRPGRFWLIAGLAGLALALGEYLPGYTWLARLPGLNLLRVPGRALFISGLSFAACAAFALDALLKGAPAELASVLRRARLAAVALAGLSALLALGAWAATGAPAPGFLWGAGMVVLAAGWLLAYLAGRLPGRVWLAGVFLLVAADLVRVDVTLFASRPSDEVLAEARPVLDWLQEQEPGDARGRFRIYSPSYSLPQHTAALTGLELADGVNPLQLAAYASFMDGATGAPRSGYSETLPPFPTGSPLTDNLAARPDPARLGLLNVAYVAAAFDLEHPDLELLEQAGDTRIYANRLSRPRAWWEPAGGGAYFPAEIREWRPNRIVALVPGAAEPGRLVLAEIYYPGWAATVDGQPAEIQPAVGLLRSVQVEPGAHEVVFTFRPLSLYAGLLLCLTGCAWLLFTWLRAKKPLTGGRADG